MSKIIAAAAIRGAHAVMERAERTLAEALLRHGRDREIAFPGTAYALPVTLALVGKRVERLGDLEEALQAARGWLPPVPTEQLWLPYLGGALDAGAATLVAHEAVEALKPLNGQALAHDFWLGPTSDGILREQGIKLVDGRMPGFAACVGALPTDEAAEQLARDLQERNILVFMGSHTNGNTMAAQLNRRGVEMNWETFLVPYGPDTSSIVHALGFACRAALTFGGLKPGGLKEAREILLYNKRRVFAFVLALGEVDDEKYATAAGAINFGFPVIADTDIPEILPSGICTYEHVVSNVAHRDMPSRAIEVRGLKLRTVEIPIPVRHGPAFEGERVRKEDLAIEFGGKYTRAFEYLTSRPMDQLQDGLIRVVGPEIADVPEAARLPLAIFVEVAGRKMQQEFESILERHIHSFLSEPMGVMHLGQRDTVWLRISKKTRDAGFRISHLGTVLLHKLKNDFPAIVDKVQITLFTNAEDVERLYPAATAAYELRDQRMGALTDEAVDIYYSCALCQSYAPNHICIITPQRLGLCGAYNWLDGKAAYEMNPHGGNLPVRKGDVIDPALGQWRGVNEFIYSASNGAFERFSAYSMITDPMTSCGCFECIACILPGTGGIMIVDREYSGQTPVGMSFSSLAEMTGGGQQTPGFIGIGTLYTLSKKFISGDGGLARLVWTTTHIKQKLGDRLRRRCEEIGQPGLYDKIADETICTELEPLIEHLAAVEHPAMAMGEMIDVMTLELKPKKWAGAIRGVTLGAGSRQPLTVGGGNGLPLHTFEAAFPHRPLLALEVTDIVPPRWTDTAREPWEGVLGQPAAAARRAVEDYGADLVMLHLAGAHPDRGNRSPEEAAADVRAVLEAVKVPLIVKGPGAGARQNDVLARVAQSFQGEGLVLHSACQEDYRTLAAAAVAYGHVLVAESPIDMNIAKQLNILLADSSVDINRVLIDPLTGGLGYGLEYTYSVMERIRLAALGGDTMLNAPLICLVGEEVWKAKEVKVPREKEPLWGDQRWRGVNWEIATGLALLEAGAEILVLRHPGALARLRAHLEPWFGGGTPCR